MENLNNIIITVAAYIVCFVPLSILGVGIYSMIKRKSFSLDFIEEDYKIDVYEFEKMKSEIIKLKEENKILESKKVFIDQNFDDFKIMAMSTLRLARCVDGFIDSTENGNENNPNWHNDAILRMKNIMDEFHEDKVYKIATRF